jgi:hypothetical protein
MKKFLKVWFFISIIVFIPYTIIAGLIFLSEMIARKFGISSVFLFMTLFISAITSLMIVTMRND